MLVQLSKSLDLWSMILEVQEIWHIYHVYTKISKVSGALFNMILDNLKFYPKDRFCILILLLLVCQHFPLNNNQILKNVTINKC